MLCGSETCPQQAKRSPRQRDGHKERKIEKRVHQKAPDHCEPTTTWVYSWRSSLSSRVAVSAPGDTIESTIGASVYLASHGWPLPHAHGNHIPPSSSTSSQRSSNMANRALAAPNSFTNCPHFILVYFFFSLFPFRFPRPAPLLERSSTVSTLRRAL